MSLASVRKMWRLHRHYRYRRFEPIVVARGFVPARAVLYEFKRWHPALYLSDFEVEGRMGRINQGRDRRGLSNKQQFHERLIEHDCHLGPTLIGVVKDGVYQRRVADIDEAIRVYGSVVVKPTKGRAGTGVAFIDDPIRLPSNGDHVVEAPIIQHAELEQLYPQAVNTIRVLVAVDEGGPFVIDSALRLGTSNSAPTDNYSRGGIVARVDSGLLSSAVGQAERASVRRFDKHPDSGAQITGLRLPCWNEVLSVVLRMHEIFSDLKLCGWDVAVTDDGPLIVEGNAGVPNPGMHQMHRPMLLDPRARSFFEMVGVISRRKSAAAARAAGMYD